MIKKPILIILALWFASCNSKTIRVEPLGQNALSKAAVYYSLPQTVITIKVNYTKTTYIPGPYADYAKKYLGIEGVENAPKEEYAIAQIEIVTHQESDPKAIFVVLPSSRGYGNFLQLCREGLVLPVSSLASGSETETIQEPKGDELAFKDLSITPFIAQENTTFYGRTLRDSAYVRVPIQRTMIIERNSEEKAREAADLIFSIRKKRLDFLTPDVDHPFAGDALQVILNELQRLENEYLSLFIGRRIVQSFSKKFAFIPSNPEGENAIIFRFSESKGVLPETDLSGRPILLEIQKPEYPSNYDTVKGDLENYMKKVKFDTYQYRIPATVNLRLIDGKQVLASKRVSVYQYGILAQLPVSFQ